MMMLSPLAGTVPPDQLAAVVQDPPVVEIQVFNAGVTRSSSSRRSTSFRRRGFTYGGGLVGMSFFDSLRSQLGAMAGTRIHVGDRDRSYRDQRMNGVPAQNLSTIHKNESYFLASIAIVNWTKRA